MVVAGDGLSSPKILLPREPPSESQGVGVRPPVAGVERSTLFGLTSEHEALIDEAVALFSREYGRTISREEARQMTERLAGLFKLFVEWDHDTKSPGKRAEG